MVASGYLESVSAGEKRIDINWVQSLAGALAAVTSAVLLSTVGVAGTLIGAALGSVAATVGSAVYSFYIRETKERVAQAQTVAAVRISRANHKVRVASNAAAAGTPGAREKLDQAGEDLRKAQGDLDHAKDEVDPAQLGWKNILAGLPWKRIAVGAAAIFVVAMMVIVGFELVAGRSVSSFTGGSSNNARTSIPGFGGGGGQASQAPSPVQPSPSAPSAQTSSPSQATPTPSGYNQTAVPPYGETPSPSPSPSTQSSSSSSPTPSPTPAPTLSSSPTQ